MVAICFGTVAAGVIRCGGIDKHQRYQVVPQKYDQSFQLERHGAGDAPIRAHFRFLYSSWAFGRASVECMNETCALFSCMDTGFAAGLGRKEGLRAMVCAMQVKSRERVREHGEVFTAEREVKAMCDLVKNETERIDSTFLEPACGDGNFLVEILTRKLAVVKKGYSRSKEDLAFQSVRALMSLYGVDILADNVLRCRDRLFREWRKRSGVDDESVAAVARFVLGKNILVGNTLSMKRVDDLGQDLDEPIVFTEWSCPKGMLVKRRDFDLSVLMKKNEEHDLFELLNYCRVLDNESGKMVLAPRCLHEYPPVDYRKLKEEAMT